MTGVLVVDDQALLRTAFSSLIDAENDLRSSAKRPTAGRPSTSRRASRPTSS